MRIAIAGLHNEASTFSLHRADESFFDLARGAELIAQYDLERRIGAETIAGVEFLPVLRASSGASGPVQEETYEAFVDEILSGIAQALPLDGVYLDLHGAFAVEGREGADEDFLRRLRAVTGPDVVLSASMDTHGNISRELAEALDLVAVHRHAPHIDLLETRDRAIRLLIEVLRTGRRPAKVHVRIPVLYPGERTSTAVEPGASVFGTLLPSIERHGVLDAGLVVGFAWADEPRCAAAVVVTGWHAESAAACAAEIAETYWAARDEFRIVAEHHGTWVEALGFVTDGAPAPVYLSDAGDNVTAGGSGDVTAALAATKADTGAVSSGRRFLFAGLTDPHAVDAAIAAGPGAVLRRGIGAFLDDRFSPPVDGEWSVERLIEGAPGEGTIGALVRDGTISVLLQKERTAFVSPDDPGFPPGVLHHLAWFEPDGFDVVVVKNGYLFPSQEARAQSSFMAVTPGGTDLDPARLAFQRLQRPIVPLDHGFAADLTPAILRR